MPCFRRELQLFFSIHFFFSHDQNLSPHNYHFRYAKKKSFQRQHLMVFSKCFRRYKKTVDID